jgi:GDP-L-galactose phosphorylase
VSNFCITFQACYFANPLPVESASTVTVYDGNARSGVNVSELVDYPLKAFVFTSKDIKALVNVVSEISFSLHGNIEAYSLLISNNGTKVFLFPQVNFFKRLFHFLVDCIPASKECKNHNI